MRHNGLHRHFARFLKLVFVERQAAFFHNRLHMAGRDFLAFAGVGDDFAIADFNHAVGLGGDFGVVGYHNNGVPVVVELVDDFHHVFAALRIQCACGLIGKDDFAAVHQGAGDGYALLLPA